MIWINLTGVFLIVVVVWWFWLWKPKSTAKIDHGVVKIIVNNGVYDPAVIEAKVGSTLTLQFFRKDKTPCSSTVLFDDFGISAELAINQKTDVVLELKKSGEFEFTCQMGMYRGRLIVR